MLAACNFSGTLTHIYTGCVEMRILALDVATKTGYAYRGEDGSVVCGAVDLADGLPKRGCHNPRKMLALWDWLDGKLGDVRPDAVVVETPFSRGAGTRLLYGLVGIAEAAAAKHSCVIATAGNTQWRKSMVGKGHADKQTSIDVCLSHGISTDSDDAADASLLLLYSETRPQ
jgi:Holliday junction resolvasome RuvABC endonuclease subunit